jgi:hypothetical protein
MLATIVCGLLASGASAVAQSSDGRCSNPTLLGSYGFAAKGVLLPAPGISLAFRSVGIALFDGQGNLTWLQPGRTEASGSYTANPNCTGTAVINTPTVLFH